MVEPDLGTVIEAYDDTPSDQFKVAQREVSTRAAFPQVDQVLSRIGTRDHGRMVWVGGDDPDGCLGGASQVER